MNRIVICLILLTASSMASARDMRMHGPNGDGGDCPEAATSGAAAAPAAATTKPAPTAIAHTKAKTPPLFRGGDDDAMPHMPRWHSFLPGMFR